MVSTRRKENDKSRDYKVGDTVEVVRADGIQVGTLLYKMARNRATSSPQSVPHWKVAMKESTKILQSTDENDGEDVSEHMLGRVLASSSSASSLKVSSTTVVRTTTAGSASDGSASSSPTPTSSIVATGKGKKKTGKQKTVTLVEPPQAPSPVPVAPVAKGGRRKKGSAPVKEKIVPTKGKKTVVKQAKKSATTAVVAHTATTTATSSMSSKSKGTMTVTATSTATKTSPRTGARAGTRSNAAYSSSDILTGIDDIGRIPLAASALKKKQVLQSKKKEQRQLRHMAVGEETSTVNKFGETVVKVKLLTGTLYIYKGNADGTAKRRAEFVRSK